MTLSDTDLLGFKLSMLKQKARLIEADKTGEQAEEVVELDPSRVGRLSRMDAMQAQAMSLETGRRRRQRLIEIEAALGRLQDGGFGECFECGHLINPARLAVDPTATLCIACAQARE